MPTDVPLSKLKNAVMTQLLKEIKDATKKEVLWDFISRLYAVYLDLNFTCRGISTGVVFVSSPL